MLPRRRGDRRTANLLIRKTPVSVSRSGAARRRERDRRPFLGRRRSRVVTSASRRRSAPPSRPPPRCRSGVGHVAGDRQGVAPQRAARSAAAAPSRSAQAARPPSARKRRTMARPKPLAAPETSTTLPRSRSMGRRRPLIQRAPRAGPRGRGRAGAGEEPTAAALERTSPSLHTISPREMVTTGQPLDAASLVGRVVGIVMQDVVADDHLAPWVPDREVGVRADGDDALARIEPVELRGRCRRAVDELRQSHPSALHTLGEQQRQARLDAGNAVRACG